MSPWDRDAFSPQCSLVKELQGFHQSSPGKPLNENENLGRDKGKLWGAHLRILIFYTMPLLTRSKFRKVAIYRSVSLIFFNVA